MDNNKKHNADTTNNQSANRTEFAEDCHNNASNSTNNNKKKNK